MSIVSQKKNFASIEELPTFDADQPLADVFRELNGYRKRGFLMKDAGRVAYVDARRLADVAVDVIGRQAADRARRPTIGWLCHRAGAERAVSSLETRSVDINADEDSVARALEAGVTSVVAGTERVGVLFPGAKILELGTRRIYFVCKLSHRNLDPDDGRCGRCNRPIVGTELA